MLAKNMSQKVETGGNRKFEKFCNAKQKHTPGVIPHNNEGNRQQVSIMITYNKKIPEAFRSKNGIRFSMNK